MFQHGQSEELDMGVRWMMENGVELTRQNWIDIMHNEGLPEDFSDDDYPPELKKARKSGGRKLVVNRGSDKLIESVEILE